jgi:periplasmic protein TonB
MFDLITGEVRHLPSHAGLPIFLSTSAQVIAVTAVLVVPMMLVVDQIPEIPTMMAFVAAPPPPPPPPPPPAPKPPPEKPVPQTARVSESAVPVEEPRTIEPEPVGPQDLGEEGGVEGGVPGGVVGPVRIGGQIQAPALLRRVEPTYPPVALSAHVQAS